MRIGRVNYFLTRKSACMCAQPRNPCLQAQDKKKTKKPTPSALDKVHRVFFFVCVCVLSETRHLAQHLTKQTNKQIKMTGRKPKWPCINEDTQGRRGLALMKKKGRKKKKVVVQPKYIYRAGGCAEVSGLAGAELSCRIYLLEQKGYAKETEGNKKIKNRERGKKSLHCKVESCLF